jgi:hypothetical protein
MNTPVFPVTFHWLKSGEAEVLESLEDIACNIENFDSDAAADEAIVTDARGRRVRIRLVLLDIEVFELQA